MSHHCPASQGAAEHVLQRVRRSSAYGLAALVLVGLLFHRFSGHSYPHRPAMAQDKDAGFHPEAIDQALADLGETFDVSREDLDLLLQRAAFHERERRSAARRGAAAVCSNWPMAARSWSFR